MPRKHGAMTREAFANFQSIFRQLSISRDFKYDKTAPLALFQTLYEMVLPEIRDIIDEICNQV